MLTTYDDFRYGVVSMKDSRVLVREGQFRVLHSTTHTNIYNAGGVHKGMERQQVALGHGSR